MPCSRVEEPLFEPDKWIHCFWTKRTEEMDRFHRVLVHQDLWGEWTLTRVWGGRRRSGRMTQETVVSHREAVERQRRILQRRRSRGYLLREGPLGLLDGPGKGGDDS